MAKVKVFIVEDDFIHANRLEMYLDEMGYEWVGTADRSTTALNLIAASKPDLLLVDIHLAGELSGIQIVESVNSKEPIPVIFITSFRDKETFEAAKLTDPYAYILKPYDKETLQTAIELAVFKFAKIKAHPIEGNPEQSIDGTLIKDSLFLKAKGRLIKIKMTDILYIEAKDKVCLINFARENFEVRTPLQKLDDELPHDHFIRIHRSFIVNKKEISEVDLTKNVVQVGSFVVPIGRSYRASFINQIDEV